MKQHDYFSLEQLRLPEDTWKPLASGVTPTAYRAGQLIYLQNSPAERFYYLLSGQVRSYISSEDGTQRRLTDYHGGNLFGEAAFFDRLPRVSSAVAVTDCSIAVIGRQRFTEIIRSRPEVAMALLTYLARTVRLLSGELDDSTFLQADQRLARLLLELFAETDPIRITQEELADAIGVSRMTISRVLGSFTEQGLLKTGYRSLTLLDREGLTRAAEARAVSAAANEN